MCGTTQGINTPGNSHLDLVIDKLLINLTKSVYYYR